MCLSLSVSVTLSAVDLGPERSAADELLQMVSRALEEMEDLDCFVVVVCEKVCVRTTKPSMK